MYLLVICLTPLKKKSIHSFARILTEVFLFVLFVFFLLLSWMSSFYILATILLSDIFAHIFSHLEGCVFVLLMVAFEG